MWLLDNWKYIALGLLACYVGYLWGVDVTASQYADSAKNLLDVFLKGTRPGVLN